MSGRALRRHHERRVKARVAAYYGGYARESPRQIGKIAHARQLCSCTMCGNPRRRLGERTLQELRAADRRTADWRGVALERRVASRSYRPQPDALPG